MVIQIMSSMEMSAVKVPEGVSVNLEGRIIEVTGPKGSLVRDFSYAPVSIHLETGEIRVSTLRSRRKEAALVGTVCSHIENMIKGVTKGFTYKLKIVFSHFPISVKVSEKKVLIENFMGERYPRVSKIVGDTKITVKGDDMIVQGINIENVSQTAANIEQATKITRKDPRIYLDGIYVYEKLEGIAD